MEKVDPAPRHRLKIDFRQRQRVETELDGILTRSLFEGCAGDLVSLEIDDPDFFRQENGQINGALNDDIFAFGNAAQERNGDVRVARKPDGEWNFALNLVRVLENLAADFRIPE